ncbi:hypothetical protein SAZ10_33150 [Mesorhizobium sp. BAC0120]|uniref:hypothetical protein n=1 Tax=Mesorhizobium sp. BAC0120 TaxID=3090670 RepID=UPI00298BD2EB|nr:hypothetical protein [Mesorhizobium sp. BAC0120]MDW6026620.1 hypothetical protein [Mesorhizobium sp. BAC0120]
MSDVRAQIAVELVNALQRLGAKPDLLGPIGSYRVTLQDEGVLRRLWKRNNAMGLSAYRHGTPGVDGGIEREIMIAAQALDAPIELLRVIDGWGATLSDEAVLQQLWEWNRQEDKRQEPTRH